MIPSGKSLNKSIKVFPLTEYDNIAYVRRLFIDPSRISHIEIVNDCIERHALVHFPTHSAARKTLYSFSKWNRKHCVEWVNVKGEVTGDVWDYKKRNKRCRVSEQPRCSSADSEIAELLLGKELMAELSYDTSLSVSAEPFIP